jgi:hypothetical protein
MTVIVGNQFINISKMEWQDEHDSLSLLTYEQLLQFEGCYNIKIMKMTNPKNYYDEGKRQIGVSRIDYTDLYDNRFVWKITKLTEVKIRNEYLNTDKWKHSYQFATKLLHHIYYYQEDMYEAETIHETVANLDKTIPNQIQQATKHDKVYYQEFEIKLRNGQKRLIRSPLLNNIFENSEIYIKEQENNCCKKDKYCIKYTKITNWLSKILL